MLKIHASAAENLLPVLKPIFAMVAKASAKTTFLNSPIVKRKSPREMSAERVPASPPKLPN
jgi:hypothetical protein